MTRFIFSFLFLWVFAEPFFCAAKDYVYKDQLYDDRTVADLITIITITNPIPSIPSARIIYNSQKSLFRVPAFALCKKIVVCDGIQPGYESWADDYEKYQENLMELTYTDPYFTNTELIFCQEWVHISGAVQEAIKQVTTPFLFIHQHDFVVAKEFDLNGLIVTMIANPEIKHVRINQNYSVDSSLWYDIVAEPAYIEPNLVPLWSIYGWSDNDHVTTLQYYKEFVLPQCDHEPMEQAMDPLLKEAIFLEGTDAALGRFGTYIYGKLNEGAYLLHSDGRNSS